MGDEPAQKRQRADGDAAGPAADAAGPTVGDALLKRNVLVGDPIILKSTDDLSDASDQMVQSDQTAAVVFEDSGENRVWVLTENDILRAFVTKARRSQKLSEWIEVDSLPRRDARRVPVVQPSVSLVSAAELMLKNANPDAAEQKACHHLVVMSAKNAEDYPGECHGIMSALDLARALVPVAGVPDKPLKLRSPRKPDPSTKSPLKSPKKPACGLQAWSQLLRGGKAPLMIESATHEKPSDPERADDDVRVEDVMKPRDKVQTCSLSSTMEEVGGWLLESRQNCVVAIDAEGVHGVLTTRDVLGAYADGVRGGACTVKTWLEGRQGDIARRLVDQGTPLAAAARAMSEHRLHHLIVMNEDGGGRRTVVGVVSALDLAQAMSPVTREQPGGAGPKRPADVDWGIVQGIIPVSASWEWD